MWQLFAHIYGDTELTYFVIFYVFFKRISIFRKILNIHYMFFFLYTYIYTTYIYKYNIYILYIHLCVYTHICMCVYKLNVIIICTHLWLYKTNKFCYYFSMYFLRTFRYYIWPTLLPLNYYLICIFSCINLPLI